MSTDIGFILQPGGRAMRPHEGSAHSSTPTRSRQGQPQLQAFASLLTRGEAPKRDPAEGSGIPASDDKPTTGEMDPAGREPERPFLCTAHVATCEPSLLKGETTDVGQDDTARTEAGAALSLVGVPDAARHAPADVFRHVVARSDLVGPEEPLKGASAIGESAGNDPVVSAVPGPRPEVSDSGFGAGETVLTTPAISPDTIAARVVVERVETHHMPRSAIERVQAMSALSVRPHGPTLAGGAPTTSAARDDAGGASLEVDNKVEAPAGREPIVGSDPGASAERLRPDRRGDNSSGSGSRRGSELLSPFASPAQAARPSGPEAARQDFTAARDDAVAAPSLAAPIAAGLRAAVDDLRPSEVASTGPVADPQFAAPDGTPVKSLELTLQPDQLGPIAVRMRLENGALTISMTAHSRDDTAALVVEREAIEDFLRKSGHALDAVTVSISPEPAARPADADSSQQAGYQRGSDVGSGRGETAGAQSRDQEGRRPHSFGGMAGRDGRDAPSPSSDRSQHRGPGIYV